METYFASANRADPDQIQKSVDLIMSNPIIAGLLKSARGLTAVLNEHRQILAVNTDYLQALGIEDPGECLGLRPGELLGCAYAGTWPGGCGTTPSCPACGAVIAMVASLEEQVPVEKTCALRVEVGGNFKDLCFRVHSVPVRLDGNQLLLFFMQDITEQEERLALSRIFLHDINNLAMVLAGAEELLMNGSAPVEPEDRDRVVRLSTRLLRVIKAQRSLLALDDSDFSPSRTNVTLGEVLTEVKDLFKTHRAAAGINLKIEAPGADRSFRSDMALVHRILANMVVNACEASAPGETVTVGAGAEEGPVSFFVHNEAVMPPHVAGRVFQRHFSTKAGEGRGLGTYSMMVLAEEILGGRIGFQSRPGLGTTFTLTLPS